MPQRKSRAESRSETRALLLDAALAVFTEKGYATASVEEIAARAGFTRGAFYSNFADKDEILFTLMDARMEQRIAEVEAVMESSSPLTVFADLNDWSHRASDENPLARVTLNAEFRVHALRNETARQQLAARERVLLEQYARAIQGLHDAVGVEPPAPVEDLAALVFVLDSFIPLQRSIDPDRFRGGLMFDLLTTLFRAGIALAEKQTDS